MSLHITNFLMKRNVRPQYDAAPWCAWQSAWHRRSLVAKIRSQPLFFASCKLRETLSAASLGWAREGQKLKAFELTRRWRLGVTGQASWKAFKAEKTAVPLGHFLLELLGQDLVDWSFVDSEGHPNWRAAAQQVDLSLCQPERKGFCTFSIETQLLVALLVYLAHLLVASQINTGLQEAMSNVDLSIGSPTTSRPWRLAHGSANLQTDSNPWRGTVSLRSPKPLRTDPHLVGLLDLLSCSRICMLWRHRSPHRMAMSSSLSSTSSTGSTAFCAASAGSLRGASLQPWVSLASGNAPRWLQLAALRTRAKRCTKPHRWHQIESSWPRAKRTRHVAHVVSGRSRV